METFNLFLLRWIRRFLLEALFLIMATLVALLTRRQWRVWRRNSLALGYWDRKSDLDLTLYSVTQKKLPNSVLVLWRYSRRFGEWAAFSSEDRRWVSVANPLELARDPRLISVLGAHIRPSTRAEGFVFWLRMVGLKLGLNQIDFSKIVVRPRKWAFHREQFERVNGLSLQKSFPHDVEEMGELLSPVPSTEWPHQRRFLVPHQWLGEVLDSGTEAIDAMDSLIPSLNEVMRAQVQWEVWGLLSQIRLQNNKASVQEHMANLARLFPETDDMRVLVNSFNEYVDQLNEG